MRSTLLRSLPFIIIIFITLITWYKLLNQAPSGEGYYYFDEGQNFISKDGRISDLWGLDNFAKIAFDILPITIGDNLSYYFAFQIIFMILLNLSIYYVASYLTKNKLIGLSTAIFFAVSYIGNFEMLGSGNYQRFVQRVPNLIPLLFSFQQFYLFFKTKKIKHYGFSILLFTFAMLMAHFSSFLLPLYVLYALMFTLIQDFKPINLIKAITFTIPFYLINVFLISHDIHTPQGSFIAFIRSFGILNLIQQILLQFVSLNIPPFIIEKTASLFNPFKNTLTIFSFPILVVYIIGGIFLKFKDKNYFAIYVTIILFIFSLLFLNLYLGKVDPVYNIRGYNYYFLPPSFPGSNNFIISLKGDRYYYVPTIFTAWVWSFLFWTFFYKKNKSKISQENTSNILKSKYLLLFLLILIPYSIYNINLNWTNLDKLTFNSILMKNYISFIKSKSKEINSETVVITTRELLWPSSMLRVFYTPSSTTFTSFDQAKKDKIDISKLKNVLVVDYDPTNWKIRDITKEYIKSITSKP